MNNIGFVTTIGSDIEVTFCSPYCCVCGVTFSTKRNLRRHILGDGDAGRHPCPTIESILRQELEKASIFRTDHFSARIIPATTTSLVPSVAPSSESPGPFGPPASSAATASSSVSPLFDSSASFALSALPVSSTPPAAFSAPPVSSTSGASSTPSDLPVSSTSSAPSDPLVSSTSVASSAPPVSAAASLVPNSASTQDQYQSIMLSLQNLVTQDQFQALVSMISRLEDTVKGLRNDVSRNSEWTERTIGIHERRQLRQASPYSSNTALTPSPHSRHHRLSGSVGPTASQHSIKSFNGVTTSTPKEEEHR
ncbi:hypothetical protein F5H01DRAFT_415203 [Linnemannia elongata]|nr:hypothetical protein F5H01DRAFT_415203 [Linnemannia elongata]